MKEEKIPKLDIPRIKRVTNLLSKEQLGLVKKLSALAVVRRDIENIPDQEAYLFKDFFLNCSFKENSFSRKFIALNLIYKEDNDLIVRFELLYVAGYNGIDIDDLKKPENAYMLKCDDLNKWADFLQL